ncbi:class I SAM-dependent methyltransferase [Nocardioides sp. GY 10127]|uniref:class I SAM-dependent methyltransferase n=1 Tax=Nocardioides sp. GY 10127 TaxID=2569762 RepID=UPI0010A7AF7E|nr:class I SAM-dependent methyltransferase [Nocardioides sp. GY 10127]TIC79099.1 class I SAM-dependent methyltransferase [Nocardioides sp. GY 10127]
MPNNALGDFQTPPALAAECLALLDLPARSRVLEPTCGTGAFLEAAAARWPEAELLGVEVQAEHAEVARRHARVVLDDVLALRLDTDLPWRTAGPLAVVGNPPWVTSADLTRLGVTTAPRRRGLKPLAGLDALTGASNFDVAETLLLTVLEHLADQPLVLGVLVKTQVAREVLRHAARAGLPVVSAELFAVDARRWFGASVDACWCVLRLDPAAPRGATEGEPVVVADVHPGPARERPSRRLGVTAEGRVVEDLAAWERVRAADGRSPLEWRSGVKHDAASALELEASPAGPTTRDGAPVHVEPGHLHPLLKGGDLHHGRAPHRLLVLPQARLGEDTAGLRTTAPALWAHLERHAATLDGRRSRIYAGRPRFSVFGLGPYTFAPWKVAVSGLHREARFRLVGPAPGADGPARPVLLDDTAYQAAFTGPDAAVDAAVAWALLVSPAAADLLAALVPAGAKRPVTARLLSRLDLRLLPVDDAEVVRAAGAGLRAADGPAPSEEDLVAALARLRTGVR